MDLLGEIRAAFRATPYPGDAILSNCWCDECEFSVRNLRGKSWKELRIEDLNDCEGGHLAYTAFRYYLPGLMCLAVQNPDELDLSGRVVGGFIVAKSDHAERVVAVRNMVKRLSTRQRAAIVRFFQWLDLQGWQAPVLIQSAMLAASDGRVVPYDTEELLHWCRNHANKSKRN